MVTENRPRIGRIVALFEVLLCSDFPTQLAIGSTLSAFGMRAKTAAGLLSLRYIVSLSLLDAALLIGLIVLLLWSHGERVHDVLVGRRSPLRELQLGGPLTIGALAIGVAIIVVLRALAPALHNVPRNPLQDIIHGRREAALFALVVVVAGGVREEIQRAFILHRFSVWLGGSFAGLLVSSLAFGLGHLLQGRDVALTTAVLGFYWGAVYVWRRSSIAPMVSHAGFNLVELLGYFSGR